MSHLDQVCLWCKKKSLEFGKGIRVIQCRASLDVDYEIYTDHVQSAIDKGNKNLPANFNGASSYTAELNIDPHKLIVPTLHCKINLINHFNNSFRNWVHLTMVGLSPQDNTIHEAYYLNSHDPTGGCWKWPPLHHRC
jgi:hypothetical protein